MGKKKGKKKRPQQSQPRVAGKSPTGGAEAMKALADIFASTKASPIAKMTAPPENVIEHLTRVGAPFWVSDVGVDEHGNVFQFPCLTVPFEALIRAEAEAMQPGSGDAKVQQAKRLLISENAKRQIEAVVKMEYREDPVSYPTVDFTKEPATCVCGEQVLGVGVVNDDGSTSYPTCQISGVLHRADGPCYHCDTYGQPLESAQGKAMAEAEERRVRAQAIAEQWPGAPEDDEQYELKNVQG